MITPRSGGFPFIFRKETDKRKPSVVSIHHSANHQEAGKHNGNYKKEIKVFLIQIIGCGCFFFHRMDWRPPESPFVSLFADWWPVTTPTSQRDFRKPFLWESVHLRFFLPRPADFHPCPVPPRGNAPSRASLVLPLLPKLYLYPKTSGIITDDLSCSSPLKDVYHIKIIWGDIKEAPTEAANDEYSVSDAAPEELRDLSHK